MCALGALEAGDDCCSVLERRGVTTERSKYHVAGRQNRRPSIHGSIVPMEHTSDPGRCTCTVGSRASISSREASSALNGALPSMPRITSPVTSKPAASESGITASTTMSLDSSWSARPTLPGAFVDERYVRVR
eukprot:3147820-Prymnesium_polylepis.1